MIELLVFDFDGTLVDSYSSWLKTNEVIFKKFGIKNPKQTAMNLMESGKKGHIYLIENMGLDKKMVDKISKQVYQTAAVKVKKAKFNLGFKDLENIKIKKVILSNSPSFIIHGFLKKNKISFFEKVYGCDNFKDKVDKLKQLKKKYQLKKKEIIYVGDLAKDSLKAKQAGILSCIVLKHAWDTKKEIMKSKPDFIIENLKDIEKLVK